MLQSTAFETYGASKKIRYLIQEARDTIYQCDENLYKYDQSGRDEARHKSFREISLHPPSRRTRKNKRVAPLPPAVTTS